MIEDLLNQTYYGNSLLQWTIGLSAAIVALLLLNLSAYLLDRRLSRLATDRRTALADFLGGMFGATSTPLALAAALYIALTLLQLPEALSSLLQKLATVMLLMQAAIWVNHGVRSWLSHAVERRRSTDGAGAMTLSMLGFFARVATWSIALLMILSNLGFDITALVTSLGIGGIAVALAVQNILGDLIASVSIALDKPFVIGDFIIVGDILGTVEHIGLKTTRVRSLSGEQVILANNDLLNSRIHNYQRMPQRRVVFGFGVTYSTTPETIERIVSLLRELIDAQPRTRFERAHFKEFGDSALTFEVVYFVLTPDFTVYMDIQQAINLALMRRFQDLGVEFAFPTRTIHWAPEIPLPQPAE